jgi:hypothetical protein
MSKVQKAVLKRFPKGRFDVSFRDGTPYKKGVGNKEAKKILARFPGVLIYIRKTGEEGKANETEL